MRPWMVLPLLLLPLGVGAEDAIKANTMTVHGEAVTRIAPDELTLPVTIREENANIKVAKERHDGKLRKLLGIASDLGIAKEKMQVSFTQVTPVYDYESGTTRPRLRGYQVETAVDFKMADSTRLGDFMNDVIAADIDAIGNLSYGLQDEQKVKDDTLNTAMEHAYEKASRLAATARVTLDKPLIIEEGDADIQRPMPPRPMMFARAAMAPMNASQPPEMPSGVIEIHQSVTVTYSLK